MILARTHDTQKLSDYQSGHDRHEALPRPVWTVQPRAVSCRMIRPFPSRMMDWRFASQVSAADPGSGQSQDQLSDTAASQQSRHDRANELAGLLNLRLPSSPSATSPLPAVDSASNQSQDQLSDTAASRQSRNHTASDLHGPILRAPSFSSLRAFGLYTQSRRSRETNEAEDNQRRLYQNEIQADLILMEPAIRDKWEKGTSVS
jgi:hypothetical protein